MPITPLHFGPLALSNKCLPGKVNWISFGLSNLWIDAPAIFAVIDGQQLPGHDHWHHTFVGSTLVAVLVTVPGMRSRPWAVGAFVGAWSHIVLDGLVHRDINPFYPVAMGNPFFLDLMEPLSWALAPLTIWFIVQTVSVSLAKARAITWFGRTARKQADD